MDAVKILVIEDDETLADTLQFNLELEGYDAMKVYSADEAMDLDLSSFSLIVLDVMMDGTNGFQFAKRLKSDAATASIPIIFCTAKDTEDDMVTGFHLGADDYIYKPYTIRNVLTRIKAVLRRTASPATPKKDAEEDVITYKGITVDKRFKRCMVDGQEVKLVKKEFEILSLLISTPGRIYTREEILGRVWKREAIVLDRTIDVNITRLRTKLHPYGRHIITRPGYGYGFE